MLDFQKEFSSNPIQSTSKSQMMHQCIWSKKMKNQEINLIHMKSKFQMSKTNFPTNSHPQPKDDSKNSLKNPISIISRNIDVMRGDEILRNDKQTVEIANGITKFPNIPVPKSPMENNNKYNK